MNSTHAARAGRRLCRGLLSGLVALWLLLQGYAAVVQREGTAPLPRYFGNRQANRAALEAQPRKDEFTFAVVGDTKSVGTFERIADRLRDTQLDFAVLLGDCTHKGTEEHHRYFRAECPREYTMPFPVFYVVGNHDVSPDLFPISRFEAVYGPSIFSFVFQDCRFIVLRVLGPPFTNEDSLAFLAQLRDDPVRHYRHTFAFMHTPPAVSPDIQSGASRATGGVLELLRELGVDYVFAGDYHGYARLDVGGISCIVTGGGGARISAPEQFHHAVLMRVGPDAVSEKILPVPRAIDAEDRLEKFAMTELWPWLSRHPVRAGLLNLGAGLALLAAWRPRWLGVGRRAGTR